MNSALIDNLQISLNETCLSIKHLNSSISLFEPIKCYTSIPTVKDSTLWFVLYLLYFWDGMIITSLQIYKSFVLFIPSASCFHALIVYAFLCCFHVLLCSYINHNHTLFPHALLHNAFASCYFSLFWIRNLYICILILYPRARTTYVG